MSDRLSERILALKQKAERSKQVQAEATGALKELKRRLKKEFGVETVEEAIEKLRQMQTELEQLDEEISTGVEKLEQAFGGKCD
jgi:pheromone shutdown protein TraB